MRTKRPLGVSSSSGINVEDLDDRQTNVKKRIVEDKENRTRPASKNIVSGKKSSRSLTEMYGDDDEDDELEEIIPKKTRKPTKPKEQVKPNKPKPRDPSPEELSDEATRESIPEDIEKDETPNTSIEEESSISIKNPPKRARGRPKKSQTETPQPQKPRQRGGSAQPSSKSKPTSSAVKSSVPGRKPKLAVVPETQFNASMVEEADEVDDIVLEPRPRQGSILPQSVTKPSVGQTIKKDRFKDLQTQAEKNFALYKERAEKRFKATDDLVTTLTAQLEAKQDSVNPSQLKDLELKVKSLQEELQRANTALANKTSQNEVLNSRLAARTQSNTSQLREELHSDLSGLIFRNVEQGNGNVVFDCIQTGRNGTLHYKLAMEDKDPSDRHGQIVYTPLLDPNRDEKIINLLPDYLADEIMFAREQANMFYWRLNQYLQKKVD